MNRFLNILDYSLDHAKAKSLFLEAVAKSSLSVWKAGQRAPAKGRRIVIGIALWNGYDLRLLDIVSDALTRINGTGPLVEVFDFSNMDIAVISDELPGFATIFQTPVAGVWEDGVLEEKFSGFFARESLARMFGSSSDEIVQFVRNRTAPQPPAPTPAVAS